MVLKCPPEFEYFVAEFGKCNFIAVAECFKGKVDRAVRAGSMT